MDGRPLCGLRRNPHPVPMLVSLHCFPEETLWYGIAVVFNRDIARDIDDSWQRLINRRDIGRKALKTRLFHKPCLLRVHHAQGSLGFEVCRLVAPLDCLSVQIVPVAESPSRKEIAFYIGKRPLHARFSIRVAHPVRNESGRVDPSQTPPFRERSGRRVRSPAQR